MAAALLVAACGEAPREPEIVRSSGAPSAPGREDPAGAAARVVVLGDSLAAGFGLPEEEAFPARLERLLIERGRPVEVINAGVSGDTSAGGLARLDWVLGREPDLLLVALGANDGLRGLSPEMTEANLRRIVEGARARGVRVLLAGMRLPPSLGPDYVERFEAVYPRLAAELGVPLVPFLLEGVGGRPELNLADGIHPNPRGHRAIAETVLPYLVEALDG